jgi:hypothetical protein
LLDLVDGPEAERILATTQRHLRELRSRRLIPFVRIGKKIRYSRKELEGYVAANTFQATSSRV